MELQVSLSYFLILILNMNNYHRVPERQAKSVFLKKVEKRQAKLVFLFKNLRMSVFFSSNAIKKFFDIKV